MSTLCQILPGLLLDSRVPGRDFLKMRVSTYLRHQFSSLLPEEVQNSSGIVWTKLKSRTELFLAAWIWNRHVLHIVLLITFC